MMNALNRIAPLPAQKLLLVISLFFWCGVMHLYWPNNGGSGLSLPLNITSWIYAVVLAASASVLVPRQRWRITVPATVFSMGALILTLLCLLTPGVWQFEAQLVAGALLGGVLVYLVTLQIPLAANTLTVLLTLLWGACVIECLAFLYQYWHLPGVDYWEFAWRRGTRPYGIFQQVNLMASFTASGVLLSAPLFLRLRDRYRIVIGIALVMMGFVLHESQSQTGYVSVVVGEVLLLVVFPAQRRMLLLLLLPLALGMVAGTIARHFLSVATVDHLTTSQVRWTVLKTSLALFAERPWTGWGVGSFAAVFLERAGPLGLSSISHPHNELVLWLVEGGLVGLVGALCCIASGFWLWMHGNRWRRACLVASRLSGGDAAGGDSYADGIPRQAVNAALATADPVASMCRQRPSWNTPGAYVDVADSRARGYLATDSRAIAASHAAYATATDAGGEAVIAVASCRIAPCRRLASYQSLSV